MVDCKRINIVLRYLVKERIGVHYRPLEGPVRLLGFTDSAFKALNDEGSGLALRGLAVVLTTEAVKKPDKRNPSALLPPEVPLNVHLLEWLVRRLRRVVRSTFAAELNALIDSIETLLLLQLVFHQIYYGLSESMDTLVLKLEQGELYPPIDVFVDAKSVADALQASDLGNPQEASLKLHLISVRDRLQRGLLRSLNWCDTRDMLGDCLTKGGIDRKMMQDAMRGSITFKHEIKSKVTDSDQSYSGK